MSLVEELTPVERGWGEKLKTHYSQTGQCLAREELVALAREENPSAFSGKSQRPMQHLLFCPNCQSRLIEIRAEREMAAQARKSVLGAPPVAARFPSELTNLIQSSPQPDPPDAPTAKPSLSIKARFATPSLPAYNAPVQPTPMKSPAPATPVSRNGFQGPSRSGGFAAVGIAAVLILGFVVVNINRGSVKMPAVSSPGMIAPDHAPTFNAQHGNGGNATQEGTVRAGLGRTRLQWTPVFGATEYEIELQEKGSFKSPLTYRSGSSRYDIPEGILVPDTAYTWRVTAFKNGVRIR